MGVARGSERIAAPVARLHPFRPLRAPFIADPPWLTTRQPAERMTDDDFQDGTGAMMDRRQFLRASVLGTGAVALGASGACSVNIPGPKLRASYASQRDGVHALPRVPVSKIPERFRRQRVPYGGTHAPGTIVVSTSERHLWLVEGGGTAMRYGIGVGKQGFSWGGSARVALKREWPTWTPPSRMIGRKPELARWRGGMPGGVGNPLGARAMYLYRGGRDTLYRIHGSPEWWSIGTRASSGCIRLINQDVIDLYGRVKVGARVVVKQG